MKLSLAVLLLAVATAAAAAAPPPFGRSVVGAGYVFKPDPADYYPATSRALNEEGLTKVRLCYDLQGVPSEVTVDTSSGFPRLDAAAVRYGKAVRIRPGTVNGQPQPGCVVVPVRFSPKKSPQPPEQGGEVPLPPAPPPPHPAPRFIPLGG
jgi:TonB family protein